MEASQTPLERLLNRLPSATPLQRFLEHVSSPTTREAFTLHIRHSARLLAGVGFLIYLSLVCSFSFLSHIPSSDFPAPGGVAQNPTFHVDTSTGRIKDRFGRERIFHGVNVVFKGEPWLPQMQGFDPQLSFSDDDINILRQLGLNVIRLGVMWPGVHPERGVVNQTYLGIIKDLVHRLHAAGIYTLIDFHQDVFAARFCGEGVPNWLLDDVPFSGGDPGSASSGFNSRHPLTESNIGPSTGIRAALTQGQGLRREALGSELASSTSLRGGGSLVAAKVKAEQGVFIGGLKNQSEGRAANGVGEVELPCVGYAVCMKPPEYADSFPEPLLSRYYGGRRGNDPAPGAFRGKEEVGAGWAGSGRKGDRSRSRGRGLLAQGSAAGSLQSLAQPESQFLSQSEPHSLSQAQSQSQSQTESQSQGQVQRAVAEASEGLRRKVEASYKYKTPSRDQCLMIDWGIYHFTFAVSRGFQDLYENRWGWRDRLAEYWSDIATAVKGEEGVLGFDLINEPWVGDIFFNPLLLAPGVADRLNYEPFYNHLQSAIRKVDPSRILFFEGTTYDNAVSGFTAVPGGPVYANMSVLSYHYYHPPNVAPRATFQQRERERERLKCGWMLTEFGIPNSRPDWVAVTGTGTEEGADTGTGTAAGTGTGTGRGTRAGRAGRKLPGPSEDQGSGHWFSSVPDTACLPAVSSTGTGGGIGTDSHTAGSHSAGAQSSIGAHRCRAVGTTGGCSRKAESWAQFAEEWGRVANTSCVQGGLSRGPGTGTGTGTGTSVGSQCVTRMASAVPGCAVSSENLSPGHILGRRPDSLARIMEGELRGNVEREEEGGRGYRQEGRGTGTGMHFEKGTRAPFREVLTAPDLERPKGEAALSKISAALKAGFDPRRPEALDALRVYGVIDSVRDHPETGSSHGEPGESTRRGLEGSDTAVDGVGSVRLGNVGGGEPKGKKEGIEGGLEGEKRGRKVIPGSWSEMVETLELADEHAQSWMAWEYKPYQPITGANYGLFQPDGSLHPLVQQFFWRTFPVAVAGTIQRFRFDPYSSNFTLTYTAGVTTGEGDSGLQSGVGIGAGSWVGGMIQRIRGGFGGVHSERMRSQGGSSGRVEGRHRVGTADDDYSDTPGKAYSDTAEDDYSDMAEGGRIDGRRHSDEESLQRVTEIHVCCNMDMEVVVKQEGVEVHKNNGGNVVQLWHRPQHAGKTITVQIYPRGL